MYSKCVASITAFIFIISGVNLFAKEEITKSELEAHIKNDLPEFMNIIYANESRGPDFTDDYPVRYKVIYNSDGYDCDGTIKYPEEGIKSDSEIIKGKPLTYRMEERAFEVPGQLGRVIKSSNRVSIGYNIFLPDNQKPKAILVMFYGGFLAAECKKGIFMPTLESAPRGTTSFLIRALVKRGIAVVTLNLSDLKKLAVFQSDMEQDLHDEIHTSIDAFFRGIKGRPERWHADLEVLKGLDIFLYGASFGGGQSIRHSQILDDYLFRMQSCEDIIKNLIHEYEEPKDLNQKKVLEILQESLQNLPKKEFAPEYLGSDPLEIFLGQQTRKLLQLLGESNLDPKLNLLQIYKSTIQKPIYGNTFKGYISHNGGLWNREDNPNPWLYPMSDLSHSPEQGQYDFKIQVMEDPVLLFQSLDDNRVLPSTIVKWYERAVSNGKKHLVRLVITPSGSPIVAGYNYTLKGHGIPADNIGFLRYIDALTKFMLNGPSQLPMVSEWFAYETRIFSQATDKYSLIEDTFLAKAYLFLRSKETIDRLGSTALNDAL